MNRISLWGVLATVGFFIIGALLAYVVLPRAQFGSAESLFSAWCSALGVPRSWSASRLEVIAPAPTSDVVLTHHLLPEPQPAQIGHGATLALRCSMCHGPSGVVYANSPNLAGQYAAVIYKQLRDYKSGVRTNAIMTAMANVLSDADMQDLSFYFASLPRPSTPESLNTAPAIVKWGAPTRNVAACGSCHGAIDHTMASPWLKGEPAAYIRQQLVAFASGKRINDINGQMRAMARGMTAEEIQQAAAYFGGGAQ
jgi:cytochrome c553